ncbi:MAG TPA: MCE family protein [Actinomycetota bacterium]|nr:MCE family protein [Actinomycetota bacterium]
MRRALAIVAIALLASGLAACGTPGGTINVDAIFRQIGDLPRFANVQSSDVVIGSVRAIRLDGYDARVTLRIDKTANIPSNAIALIRSTSLLGEEFVDLRPPSNEPASTQPLRNGDVIPLTRTDRIPGLDDALISLGRLLEGGTTADLATVIRSSAQIVKDKGAELGQIFAELRQVTPVLAGRAPDLSTAISNLNSAISTIASSTDVVSRAISSTADATGILAQQRSDLDRLVLSLGSASSVLARITTATEPAADRQVKDLTAVLDEVMTATGDLDKALSSLALFTDLWPKAIPGDYLQLDVVLSLTNTGPPGSSAASVGSSSRSATPVPAAPPPSLEGLLWGATR